MCVNYTPWASLWSGIGVTTLTIIIESLDTNSDILALEECFIDLEQVKDVYELQPMGKSMKWNRG